jgi:hypothetical protein
VKSILPVNVKPVLRRFAFLYGTLVALPLFSGRHHLGSLHIRKNETHENSRRIYVYGIYLDKRGEFISVPDYLSATPRRRMGE